MDEQRRDAGGSKEQAVLAFLLGAASVTGASALGHQRRSATRAARPAYSGRQKLWLNLGYLTIYACFGACFVLGWHLRPGLLGFVIGCFLGLGAATILILLGGFGYAVIRALRHQANG